MEEAYRKAISDLGGDSVAIYSLYTPEEKEELISRLNEAYEVLSDPERRAAYDARAASRLEPAVTRDSSWATWAPAVDARHFKRCGRPRASPGAGLRLRRKLHHNGTVPDPVFKDTLDSRGGSSRS
ncbi:MAG: J domain-containing protein [Deltaproteobacteria bacterium]|nr:J domain-containing protein [Deltaproteobacteria bacterium]